MFVMFVMFLVCIVALLAYARGQRYFIGGRGLVALIVIAARAEGKGACTKDGTPDVTII